MTAAGASVMVTGARGFIGAHLARRLADAGAHVVEGPDVRDRDAVARALDAHGVRTVFHLAAKSTVDAGERDPVAAFDVNVRGTYTVLDACRAGPVERVVVASSHRAAGATDPYGASKACAELACRSYAQAYGLPVAALRLANVYGGGDRNHTRLVPETARALARGDQPVLRSDGSPQRDFLYVDDAVDAYLAVAGSLDDEAARGRVWNAGAGEPVAVIDLVRRLIAAAGRDVEPRIDGRGSPAGDVDRQEIDCSAMRDELGWRPRWGLDRGLGETYRWYERQPL
jgi:CDP-glucose 4,6-dehydratase